MPVDASLTAPLKTTWTIRLFEETASDPLRDGQTAGFVHLRLGPRMSQAIGRRQVVA